MNTSSFIPPATLLLSRVLNNERRVSILKYLEAAGLATNGVIARVLALRASQVTKDLGILLNAGLVDKSKIGKRWVFKLSEKWKKLQPLLKL